MLAKEEKRNKPFKYACQREKEERNPLNMLAKEK